MRRTRNRYRTWAAVTRLTRWNTANVITSDQTIPRVSTPVEIQRITDELRVDRRQKWCSHVCRDIDDSGFTLPKTLARNGSSYYHVSVGGIWAHYSSMPVALGGLAFPDCGGDQVPYYADAVEQLFSDAAGEMPTGVNLVVNAAEIGQLKSLMPQIYKLGKALIKGGHGRKTLKELANGHLLYSFGIKPLISDIKGLLNIRKSVQKRIAELERRSCQRVRIRKRTGVSEFTIPSEGYFSNSAHHFRFTGECVGSVTGVVSADVTAFYNTASPESQSRLWSGALGLATPLSSSWELLPFSFVWDWFLPIGKTIRRIERKLLPNETAVSLSVDNIVYSKTIISAWTGKATVADSDYPGWVGKKCSMPTFRFRSYDRTAETPTGEPLIPPVGWSLGKTALSVSLTVQKVLR